MSRIYTRTGDRATTSLFGGQRVSKAHPRVEAYGCLDELATQIGLARSLATPQQQDLAEVLASVATQVMRAASHVASPQAVSSRLATVSDEDVASLEREIDDMEAKLPALRSFILPGGSPMAAALQVCRTVCRRAERRLAALAEAESLEPVVLAYVNRLSDWFFVAARYANHLVGVEDEPWRSG